MTSNNGSLDLASPDGPKRCFVTIGATAPFNSLLRALFQPSFLKALHDAGYTELRVQYGGKDGQVIFDEFMTKDGSAVKDLLNIDVTGFGYDSSGLGMEMRAAKGTAASGGASAREGTVISHAGSGSILDAMRVGVPLIVVPNRELLHNHQVELAEELAKQQYVIHGEADNLAAAIPKIEKLRLRMQKWPPINSGEDKSKSRLGGIMDEEMGWVD